MTVKNGIYLSPSTPDIKFSDTFGLIRGPRVGVTNTVLDMGFWWGYDNDVYNGGFDEQLWMHVLESHNEYKDKCLFVATPDVLYNKDETIHSFWEYSPYILDLGYPIAFVTQDGLKVSEVPWGSIDAIFIGGSDRHKLYESYELIFHAVRLKKWVHVGRVNSHMRILMFWMADSWDGTTLRFNSNEKRYSKFSKTIKLARRIKRRMLENEE